MIYLMNKTNKFIEKCNIIHNNKYDYSKVEYIKNTNKVCIICPEHGEFWQTPKDHLNKRGCPVCGKLNSIKNRTKIPQKIILALHHQLNLSSLELTRLIIFCQMDKYTPKVF